LVSVVVPTYAPGDRIKRLVHSLDAQTLPTEDFEVIFVDDGSPDRTWARLQRIRDRRTNVRIERIENSGWPSRPRNVGLEMARGEYVLFMDHDDELYPEALEAGYRMAARTGADVLNGKETRTDQAKWALEVYAENMDNAIDRTDVHPLIPTNPHKLFRRALLMEHGIRFPGGRPGAVGGRLLRPGRRSARQGHLGAGRHGRSTTGCRGGRRPRPPTPPTSGSTGAGCARSWCRRTRS
jgi:glycosyltransferase involved in cell wall biosynthesis